MTRGSTAPHLRRIAASFLGCALALPPAAFANPQGAAVRHGQVRIDGGAGHLQIRQMSQRAVIDWQSFSIDRGELTRFVQPGPSSAALNRVRGASASRIEGMLRANGRIYLINPNGILVGPDGTIDVAGFVASTLDPGDRAFLRGGSMRFSGASDAAVVNLGSISALDGDVVLMGASVLNAGEIRAPRGTAALAAGNDILLAESGEERVFVRGSGAAREPDAVTNTGRIEANIAELKAHGGNLYGMAVKNEGRVAATGVTRSGGQIFLSAGGGKVRSTGTLQAKRSDGSGGRIKIDSGTTGKTEVGGTIDASGDSGAGGAIAILGREIEVSEGALILNDGATAGGATRIGGGRQGREAEFANAETVQVGRGAVVSAEAVGSGDGGQVIVFSQGALTFDGRLSVSGAGGGRGGFAELSGRREVFVRNLGEQVDLGASKGTAGTLLIDPINVSVIIGANNGVVAGTTITDGSISFFLANTGNLSIATSGAGGDGDVTFAPNSNISWATPNSLSFVADRDIVLLGGAQVLATGNGAFSATAARSIHLANGSSIGTANGNLSLSANAAGTTTGGFTGIDLDGASVSATGAGAVALTGRGGDGSGGQHGIRLRGGASLSTAGQNLTLSGATLDPLSSGLRIELATLAAGGGAIDLTGDGGTRSIDSTDAPATIGNGADTILLKSLSGDVAVLGRIQGADLQVRDLGGTESVDFLLTNLQNDVDRINAFSNGGNGWISSLEFRDADGFRVTEFLGAAGILASGAVDLRAGASDGSPLAIDRPVRSAGGNVYFRGLDVVVDATEATAAGSGSLSLEADRAILVWGDSLLSVTDGDMNLEAHRGEDLLEGEFTGITVLGSRLQSLGTGAIRLWGDGGGGGMGSDFAYPGFTNPSSAGIRLDGGTVISSGDSTSSDPGIELSGVGGSKTSDSVGVLIANPDTILSSAGRSIQVQGYGGGETYGGQRNRGILFSGGLIQAANDGDVSLYGDGGSGESENDGIQLENGARVQVWGGDLTLDGYAGETLGIGVNLADSAGDLAVGGAGSATVWGVGSGANGIFLGNGAALLGGAGASFVDVYAEGGAVTVRRQILASGDIFVGADDGPVFLEGATTSGAGNIEIKGNDVTIGAPVTASYGNIDVVFGEQPDPGASELEIVIEPVPIDNGTATINELLSAGGYVRFLGGEGFGDLLTFAGHNAAAIDLDMADLAGIENVTGTGSPDDRVRGPAAGANYQFTGPDTFNAGGVAFFSFENVLGGGGHDVFSFTGGATLGGTLDGGGGPNRLDYHGYGAAVAVDPSLGAATGLGAGFANIAHFTGSSRFDTFSGPAAASIYLFTGLDAFQVGGASANGFENLVAGPLEDRFVFQPGSRLRGLLDAGAPSVPTDDVLDYSNFGAPVAVNLATATAGNLPGGFAGIHRFQGSASPRDAFIGPDAPTNYLLAGPNRFVAPGFEATGFENLSGGTDSDSFVFAPDAGLQGNLRGGEGPGTDTLVYSHFGGPVTVRIGPNTATGVGGRFEGIERIVGSPGNDRFLFQDQSTIGFVDGGLGTDLIEINDSNLPGDHTYEITEDGVSRNPRYHFGGIEALRLFLGPGDNTVNSGFHSYTQFLHGGGGSSTLHLPGVTTLDGANPIRNVFHFGFSGPRPGHHDAGEAGEDAAADIGGLLQLEVDQSDAGTDPEGGPAPEAGRDFRAENRFNVVDPGTLNASIGVLGGAFSAAVVAQAVIATVDGNSYLVLRPFSLDGSGLSPSNLGLAALNESLGVDANLELAAAIGFDGPVFLFDPDGPYSVDLSGAPAAPAILTLLQESLSIAAAAELSEALGLDLTVSITGADGILPAGLDGSVPGQNVVLIFGDQLGDSARAELNAAIGEGN